MMLKLQQPMLRGLKTSKSTLSPNQTGIQAELTKYVDKGQKLKCKHVLENIYLI